MAKIKKVKKYQNSGPAIKRKLTPFQSYAKQYPTSAGDTLRTPTSRAETFDDYNWQMKSAAQKAALDKAFKKTYSNYDSESGRFRDPEDGSLMGEPIRRPGLKKGGSVKKPSISKKITKAKMGKLIPKKSSVSKRVGSAKKSIGNRSMKKK